MVGTKALQWYFYRVHPIQQLTLMKITKQEVLIFAEADVNSNKVYKLYLFENGSINAKYGRVGSSMQEKNYSGGEREFDKIIASKLKKGYTKAKTIETDTTITLPSSNTDLKALARKQIKTTSSQLQKLIDKLVEWNVHNITSNTAIKYNSNGLFTTPLGIVTQEGVNEARKMLPDIKANLYKEEKLKKLVSSYLRIIPMDIGHRFDVKSIFPNDDAVDKQDDILDSLEASLKAVSSNGVSSSKEEREEEIFKVSLDLLGNSDTFKKLEKWYESSKKRMHGYDNLKIKSIYTIDIEDNTKGFDVGIGNLHEVFHGTSGANILSILKNSLRVRPPSTASIAGKMFGNGIYGSKTSSKSLGYTSLNRWGQGSKGGIYMFVCDFAMGKIYYPTHATSNIPSGHDSCLALPDKTGLHNDEYIVYKDSQVRIKYLLEIE